MKGKVKSYPATYQKGMITLENMPLEFEKSGRGMYGDFGVQIADDGRVWICIDGASFLRFKPCSGSLNVKSLVFGPVSPQTNV